MKEFSSAPRGDNRFQCIQEMRRMVKVNANVRGVKYTEITFTGGSKCCGGVVVMMRFSSAPRGDNWLLCIKDLRWVVKANG